MRKIIAICLVFLCLFSVLNSCRKDKPADTITSDDSTETTPMLNNEIITTDFSKCRIMYLANTSREVLNEVDSLCSSIYSNYKAFLTADSDIRTEPSAHEILIGKTNRSESQEFISTLRQKDYGYAIINGKLVIAGVDDKHTALALQLFLSDHMAQAKPSLKIEAPVVVLGSYLADALTLNGESLQGWSVVYPNANENMEQKMATKIADRLMELGGYTVSVLSDASASSTKTILLGDSCKNAHVGTGSRLCYSAGVLTLGGNTRTEIEKSVTEFLSLLDEKKIENKTLALTVDETLTPTHEKLRIMSFNLRYNLAENEGLARVDAVAAEIHAYLPDVFGVQEDNAEWVSRLTAKLNGYTAVYGNTEAMKDADERDTLFYRSDVFRLIESGSKWLSATPSVPNSKFSESGSIRKVTYVVLERISDGVRFCYANTHLDNGGVGTEIYETREAARIKQINVLLKIIKGVKEEYGDLPVIVTGDFNITNISKVYDTMLENGYWDTRMVANATTDQPTFNHGYADEDKAGAPADILDYCFVTVNKFFVTDYQVPTEKYNGMYTSDHFPIVIDVYVLS